MGICGYDVYPPSDPLAMPDLRLLTSEELQYLVAYHAGWETEIHDATGGHHMPYIILTDYLATQERLLKCNCNGEPDFCQTCEGVGAMPAQWMEAA